MSSPAYPSLEFEQATQPANDVAEGLSPTPSPLYEVGKRAIDLVGSTSLIFLGLPVFIIVAFAIKMTSTGPLIFRQRRLGRGGCVFLCCKFRTMIQDAEFTLASSRELSSEFDSNFKIKKDPRVTPVGALLRRTSLDEFPQLWNVLRGEMSLIGPRPIVEPELEKYGAYGSRLLLVKPGLGGLWQVSGRSDTTYSERVAMDMNYIDSRSLSFDLQLIARTALVVIRGRGAY